MDYDCTLGVYQKHGQEKSWNQVPDRHIHNKEKAWYEKVKSKSTGEYYHAEDPIKRELVPGDWQRPTLTQRVNLSSIQ